MITKTEIKEYQELSIKHKVISDRLKELDLKIPKNTSGGGNYTPKIPLSKVINETRQTSICPKCNNSMIRKYWIYFFGKQFCINKDCGYEK